MENNKDGILLETGTNEIEIMEFTIDGNLYGINVAKVREIMLSAPVHPMPHAHPAVEGIFKPRDIVITVVDLPEYLSGHTEPKGEKDLFIITNFNKMHIAFRVHTVVGISRISWRDIQKPDNTVSGGADGVATGIAQCGKDLVTILDFEKIVAEIAPETGIQLSEVDAMGKREKRSEPVWVAEDSILLSQMIRTALTKAGYTNLRMFQNGAELWEALQACGVLLASLIPAEEWLFGYYARSGYAPVFGYAVEQVRVDRLCPAPGCRIEVCEFPGVEHYHYFDSRMHGRRSCIQHPKEDFLVIMADLRLGNGKLLVAWEADKIVGMAFTVMGDDTLYIKELLADTDAVQDTLLYEAAHIYKVQRMDYFIPSSADTLFLGMARVIRAEELLKVFAHKYPASELYIHIEGDEAIQENNGYYTVRDGFCFRERVPEKKYHTYTLDGFTRLLLEAEHPYMSLMLN